MKTKINYSLPAYISNFAAQDNSSFTRCQIKVFYEGETADHRLIQKDAAEKLIKTLPYSPIVSYYDKDKDTFVGHATEEAIYGIVDPTVTPKLEKDKNGSTWAICSGVLYTDRPGEVGKIAAKIPGSAQSMEIDPSSMKYQFNYDDRKHFKNFEILDGKIIGLAVLGEGQSPAFTGASFFTLDQKFIDKMNLLKSFCEKSKDGTEDNVMDKEKFEKLSDSINSFASLLWGQTAELVFQKISDDYANDAMVAPIDLNGQYAIVGLCYYTDGSKKYLKISYTIDADKVTLGDVTEVVPTYEPIEAPVEAPAPTSAPGVPEAPAESYSVAVPESTASVEPKEANLESENGKGKEMKEEKNDGTKEFKSDSTESADNKGDTDFKDTSVSGESEEKVVAPINDKEVADGPVLETPGGKVDTKAEDQIEELHKQLSSLIDEFDSFKKTSKENLDKADAEKTALKDEIAKYALITKYSSVLSEDAINSFISSFAKYENPEKLELAILKEIKFNNNEGSALPIFNTPISPKSTSLDSLVEKHLK